MQVSSKLRVPSLDLSLLDRQENKEHLITLLRTLAQSGFDADLPEDPILKLIKVSQLGLEHLKLSRSSLTARSEVNSVSSRGTDRELRRLKKEVAHQKRALENYEFFFKQPEVAETLNAALEKLDTLKCIYCHKFFTSQHFLDQHVVRRHPELAGSGAEQMKTTAPRSHRLVSSRQKELEALNATFLSQFESLRGSILTVNAKKTHLEQTWQDPTTEEGARRLREATALQLELNRLLEQQQRILSEQALQIREIQALHDQLASRASPPMSRSESQQTSFFERQSVGEAAFATDYLRSPRIEDTPSRGKAEGESTGRLVDLLEERKDDVQTRRRAVQNSEFLDLQKVEIAVREATEPAKNLPKRLPPIGNCRQPERKSSLKRPEDASLLQLKVAQLKASGDAFAVFPEKYADALKSQFEHSKDEIAAVRALLSGAQSEHIGPKKRSSEFQSVRAAFKSQAQELAKACEQLSATVTLGSQFREGALVACSQLERSQIDGQMHPVKLERQRESMLSLNFEESVSFSIRWGDEDEESGEWRGVLPDEARRLGFFFR